jgi:ubiquinol-cytochrome c reductase cytochrome b subunit
MSFYSNIVRNPLIAARSNHLDNYPTPVNLSYLWGFGSLSGIALGVQIVTGVCLARHYAPEIHLAFASVEHIIRDVRGGVALRYIHANGASMFFIVVYTHRFRGLYYGSYRQPRSLLWYSGVVIFVLIIATAFRGYVLPWGQISFWGATVITNLFSALPGVGTSIVQLLWGGFSVDNPTLNRFFSLHYLLPFLIAAVAGLHLILLHQNGSTNPLGVVSTYDRIPFYPYFYVKDLFGFFIFVLVFSFFVVYAPNYIGHPDNYIEANPLVTPAHIVPEWYFLPFYAILRTIPDKLGGVVLIGLAIVILALLPVVDTSFFRSTFFKPFHLGLFWFFACDALSLGWIGQEIVESPFIEIANFVTLVYFAFFVPILPVLGFRETSLIQRALSLSRLDGIFPQTFVLGIQSVNQLYE